MQDSASCSASVCGLEEGRVTEMDDDEVVPVFVPALIVLLQEAETAKGSPMSRDETLAIRDDGACIMLRRSAADAMAEACGYGDLDSETCWEQWQVWRSQEPRATT